MARFSSKDKLNDMMWLASSSFTVRDMLLLRFLVQKSEKVPFTKSEKNDNTTTMFSLGDKGASPQIRGLLFHNCQNVNKINQLARETYNSGEIDFRCDLTTNSFFTKWGLKKKL